MDEQGRCAILSNGGVFDMGDHRGEVLPWMYALPRRKTRGLNEVGSSGATGFDEVVGCKFELQSSDAGTDE